MPAKLNEIYSATQLAQLEQAHYQLLKLSSFKDYLKPRAKTSHKGDFGHVLVIGGDFGMPGAPCLSALAALRCGAGLVSVATHPEHVAAIVAEQPEIMCHGIAHAEQLLPLIQHASVIVIGPGLGRSEWSQELFACSMQSNLPMIVDADALYWLSQYEIAKENWVLTPHPGEAARLLNIDTDGVQQNRLAAIGLLKIQFGGTIVLKGAGTLVLGKDNIPYVCADGNAGMSTAGIGDILTGVIAALAAQHIPLEKAAAFGVLLHALAGDKAAGNIPRGLIATDLLPYLRELVN